VNRVLAIVRRTWVRRIGIALGAFIALSVIAWHIAIRAVAFPMHLLDKNAATSLAVTDEDGVLLRQEATSAGLRERWVPLDKISPHLINATLDSEDKDFYDHAGVDWSALGRSALLDVRHHSAAYGGSTLTMQLVRLVSGTPRSVLGKLHQMVLAGRLERALTKNEILEQYLNRVYYGNGAWGAQQAAQVYFGKTAAELSIAEASMLAVLPRGPSYYDPYDSWARVKARRTHILALMEEQGHVTPFDAALAERVPLGLDKTRPHFRAPHFVELVKQRLPENLSQGATVKTTLDWPLQRRVETALGAHVDRLSGENITQAAVVVLRNSDGAILAMVGSKDYDARADNGAFNGVTARLRPGSTLKPFVYAAAIERGDTPATIANDVVLPEDTYAFYSKDVKSHGFARYRESLAGSYNLSAVHTLQRVGVATVLKKLRLAGVSTLDRPDDTYDWGLAIGHAEVRLLDLTAAFTLFGRGGIPVVPRAIESAVSPTGIAYSEPVTQRPRVYSEEAAYLIYDILSDPDARKPMFGDRVPMNLPFPVALKTGTTKAYTDLWAIGVTREYTVGVWAGNFNGSPSYHVMSVDGATPLMRATYTAIAARFGNPTGIDRPDTIVEADICPLSGMKPGPHCNHTKRERFIVGHVPTEECNWHQLVCGQPAIVYPPQLRGWLSTMDRPKLPTCGPEEKTTGAVAITYPANGARFFLEPFRSAAKQKPPLAASPNTDLTWTVDGQPLDAWIPTPGNHHVVVASRGTTDAIDITYE
jgi:penicillin-binding protein 1C